MRIPRANFAGRNRQARASAHFARGIASLLVLGAVLSLALLGGCDEKPNPTTRSSEVEGASTGHFTPGETGPAAARVVSTAAPATRPTAPLPAGSSCVTPECHSAFATAPQIHGPVSKNACDACHESDTGKHVFPLKHKGNATCTFCHTVLGNHSHQHKAVDLGCTSCHQPHISNAKFLLKADTVERTCAACHEVPLKPHAHDPFAKGDCTLCHLPHEAGNPKLLRGGEGSEHCFSCHGGLKNTMSSAREVHKPAREDCGTCHNAHATDFDHLLKRPVVQTCLACHEKVAQHVKASPVAHGAMVTDKQCGNCHDAHASMQPSLLRHRTDALCLTCHDKEIRSSDGRTFPSMKAVLTESKFLHGPNRAGNCSACHDPHGSKLPNLLERRFPDSFYASFDEKKYELCFTCHAKELVLTPKTESLTNFRDGDANLHFVHVNREEKGRSCRTCHDVHGSNLPRHMASGVPFEGSLWSMPIEFEQTSDGGRCAPGCHNPRQYRRVAVTQPAPSTQATVRGVP